MAIAIADQLDLFDAADGDVSVLPDVRELDGVVYSSCPTAVREDGDGFVLVRNREVVTADGRLSSQRDETRIDALGPAQLEREARRRRVVRRPVATASRRKRPTTSAARW